MLIALLNVKGQAGLINFNARLINFNARLAAGFFKNKRIVLFDTLIQQCSEDQVVAVLAHELGECSRCFCVAERWLVQLELGRKNGEVAVLPG